MTVGLAVSSNINHGRPNLLSALALGHLLYKSVQNIDPRNPLGLSSLDNNWQITNKNFAEETPFEIFCMFVALVVVK